ncbi:hypothetical protein Tco_0176728, partial [Tanacetum coccineum]
EELERLSKDSSKWFWYYYQNCFKCCKDQTFCYKPGVLDVTEEESSESEVESWGNDEDDSNNEQDSSDEDNDQENDSDDDKTQSNDENESDSDHETDENESGLEFDQEENEEDIGDDEEEVKDEFVKTLSNNSDGEDETKITDKAKGDEDKEMDY